MTQSHLSLSSLPFAPSRPLSAADSAAGLGSNQIHKLALDQYSRLWIAGPAGLSCFDGSGVQSYDRRNGLRCAGLRSVDVGPDGTVWVGTDRGLEAVNESGSPMPWVETLEWPFGLCEHIDASKGDVWIGTANGVVRLEQAKDVSAPKLLFHADVGFVSHLVAQSDRHAFVASRTQGLVEVNETQARPLDVPLLAGRRISRLALGPRGKLLIGTDAGVFSLDPKTMRSEAMVTPHTGVAEVTALAAGPQTLWVACGKILLGVPYGSKNPAAAEIFQCDSRINDVRLDELGNVWIATDNSGLFFASCLRNCLRLLDIGQRGGVFSIQNRKGHRYDIGGENVLLSVDLSPQQEPITRPGPAGLPETTVWDTYADDSGLWVATHAGLYHSPAGGALVRAFPDVPALQGPSRVLLKHGEELLVGTLQGLSRIRGTEAEEWRAPDGSRLGYIYGLFVDDESRLWVATLGRGLWRESQPGRLEPIVNAALSSHGNTYSVVKGPGGEVAVLQDEKVVILDAALSARVLQQAYPVSGWACTWLDDRTLGIGSTNGLRLLDVVTGTEKMLIQSLLDIRSWEFTNTRTLRHDNHGNLLCGVNAGLVKVDLNGLRRFLSPPVTRLGDISWQGVAPEKTAKGLRVPSGRWSFRVRAFSAWFVDHQTLRFQFKLEGFDDQWSAPQASPVFGYNSLPPGNYQLVARAFSPLTGHGPTATLLQFSVASPWWATGWVSALAGIESLFDRLVRSRARNAELLQRKLLLEREMQERTSALQVANAELQRARIELESLSLTDALTRLYNRRHFDDQLGKEIVRSQRHLSPLSLLIIDIDYFKGVNDRLGHLTGDDYLRAVAKVLLTGARKEVDTCARYGGEEFAILIPGMGAQQAVGLADRLRLAVEALRLPNPASPSGHVTISGGIAELDAKDPSAASQLVSRADQALYAAKRQGRNRVMTAPVA